MPGQAQAAPGSGRRQLVTTRGCDGDGGDMHGAALIADPMLEALLASMPAQLVDGAQRARGLYIASGCPPGVVQAKVVERYSPHVWWKS